MNRIFFTTIFLFTVFLTSAQVGINTVTPQATLDIMGDPSDASELDGILPPRLTGNELNSKTYTAAQIGAMVYITASRTDPDVGQTVRVTDIGYYLYNGIEWLRTKTVTSGTVLNTVMVEPDEFGTGDIFVNSTTYQTIATTTYTLYLQILIFF